MNYRRKITSKGKQIYRRYVVSGHEMTVWRWSGENTRRWLAEICSSGEKEALKNEWGGWKKCQNPER